MQHSSKGVEKSFPCSAFGFRLRSLHSPFMPDSSSMNHFLWTRPEAVWQQLLRPWFTACARSGWEADNTDNTGSTSNTGSPRGTGNVDNTGGTGNASGTGNTDSTANGVAGDSARNGTGSNFATGTADRSFPTNATGGALAGASQVALSPVTPMLLAPDTGMIAWIKGRLVAEGLGCLGVHFHTPGTLRGLLAQAYGLGGRLALREDLHLLMGQAARSLPDNPVAQAAVLDPATLVRLCDRIDRAGWRHEGFSTAAARELARCYFQLLAAQGLRTVADLERDLLAHAQRVALPACGSLLAVGFGCEHSDNLLLLRAAALSARQPILCLDTTGAAGDRVATTPAALSWQASCEEYFGLAQPLVATDSGEVADNGEVADSTKTTDSGEAAAAAASGALGAWAAALAEHDSVDPSLRPALQRSLRLLTFRTLDEEAHHTVALVRHWLAAQASGTSGGNCSQGTATLQGAAAQADFSALEQGDSCPPLRIGIVLAGDGSLLGREIATGLSALGIAHYDSLGHQPARTREQRLLEGWCNWQNSNQIDDFNAFLAELCRQNLLSTGDLHHWQRAVDKALSQTLCAELGVIAASLGAEQKHDSSAQQRVQGILANWPQLPLQASFAEFWERTQPILAQLGWPLRQEPLQQRALAFGATLGGHLPRSAFIGWLRAVTRVPGRTRNAVGHEPFAKVHLVTLAEASRQCWSHLCVVGMVQGQWPPLEADSALLDPDRCAELNRRAQRPSRFGQGQFCMGDTHTFLAGARQQREAFDAAFLRLFEQTDARCVALSRYCLEPGEQNMEAFPGEYFLRSIYAATGSLDCGQTPPPTGALAKKTEKTAPADTAPSGETASGSLSAQPAEASSPPSAPSAATACRSSTQLVTYPQIAQAYLRRRDPFSGFDAYSYALSSLPKEPLRLSCSHWAEALARPAHAWYRYVLRVKKHHRASQRDFYRQSQGIWVHQWLNPTANRRFAEQPVFVPRPDVAQWRLQVAQRAEQLRRHTAAIYIRAGRQLPQWWQSDWSAALAMADGFAQTLGAQAADITDVANVTANNTAGLPAGDTQGAVSKLATASVSGTAAKAPSTLSNGANGWHKVVGECPLAPLRLQLPGHPLNGVILEGVVDLLLARDCAADAILTGVDNSGMSPAAGGEPDAGGEFSAGSESGASGELGAGSEFGAVSEFATGGESWAGVAKEGMFAGPPLWLVDYKTGADASLSVKSWENKGAGLQLVLYSFALRARGAGAVQMTLLRRGAPLQPQLELDELSQAAPIWDTLALPMHKGVFGMRDALRDAHSFVGDYPIATLPIDPAVLARKARLQLSAL